MVQKTSQELLSSPFRHYGAVVQGDTSVTLAAPGLKSVTAKCWKAGGGFGSDSTVATVVLDGQGRGVFMFPADRHPHGPVTVRIRGETGVVTDTCYLQLGLQRAGRGCV